MKKEKPLFEQTADWWLKPYVLEFEIAGLPKILSNGSHSSWRAVHAEKKKWKQLVKEKVSWFGAPPKPLEKAHLTLTRHSSKEPDHDGLVISFKALIDALTESGVIKDDKTSVIGQSTYLWCKCKPKQGHVTINIEEVIF